jgi:hypothetical protein
MRLELQSLSRPSPRPSPRCRGGDGYTRLELLFRR